MGKSSISISTVIDDRFGEQVERILKPLLGDHSIDELPIMKWSQNREKPLHFSVSLVCRHRQSVSQFFYDMISRWLIPGKHLRIALHFATNFTFSSSGDDLYTICELVLILDDPQEVTFVERNFPFIEREILMGVNSFYQAAKILEIKGLTLDDKTSLVQEKVGRVVRRFPKDFDYDVFSEMQHFLITSKEAFKAARQPSHICRIIFTLYRFRKIVEQKALAHPKKRHLTLKCKKTLLNTPLGEKEVLSIFMGLNFLKEHELFEERHFVSALSHFISGIQTVPHSYFACEGEDEQIHTFYLEIEKENRGVFTDKDLKKLQSGLSDEIQSRIEQLVPPIFMPRNEEEVMRNILVLSHQLKYLKDIPQMIISFDEQTDIELSFTVILVRIVHPESIPIRKLLQKSSLSKNLSIDRLKVVGSLRRKYPKEACVVRVRLSSNRFLREDYSVDLFQARSHLVGKIEGVFGPVRDYNGGMIAKQSEHFLQLQKLMGSISSTHALLLQNFFYSIFPVHMSTTLDPHLLQILFELLVEAMENPKESVALKAKKASDHLFVMTKFQDFSWKQKVFNRIETLKLSSSSLLTVQMQIFDSFYLGFLYLCPEKEKQKVFLETIPEALTCYTHI